MQDDFIRLIFGNRGSTCCEKIYRLHSRLPKIFPATIAKRIIRYLSHIPESFLHKHKDSFIFRLLTSQYRLAKQVEGHSSTNFQLFTRVLKTSNSTYGIVVAVSNFNNHEPLTKELILEGVQHLISGIRLVEDSELIFFEQHTSFFYLEIRKIRGGFFSSIEITKLTNSINQVLKKCLEKTSQPIVLPEIEENTFKHIQLLSKELTGVDDIPQIIISFSEYLEHELIFVVIILRVLKQGSEPLSTLISRSPSSIEIVLEKTLIVDLLEKKYPKEASIFRFKLNSSFCGNGNQISLRNARQYIKKILENTFGEMRDFNGGLIMKEDEQLKNIKDACAQAHIQYAYLEDLFYMIKPNYMRALITTHTYLKLLLLVQSSIGKPFQKDLNYRYESFSSNKTQVVVVKTSQTNWLTQLPIAIMASSSQVSFTHLREGKNEYLCFFEQNRTENFSLLEVVQKHIKKLSTSSIPSSKNILRLNLQGGDPSSLSPRLASDIHCHTLCNLLFEGLTRINHLGKPEPALAERIEISPSGLGYTFHLRSSAWSNGKDVSAYDFEKSWKKALMDTIPSFLCPKLFFHIKNAQKAKEGIASQNSVRVYARDQKTLYVELEAPCHYFLHLVSTPLFFPMYGDAEEPKYFNGAFYLEKWNYNHSISLSHNPFYWNSKKINLNGILFHMDSDVESAYTKYLNHELDIIGDPLSPLNPSKLEVIAKEHSLFSKQTSRIFWIHCNTRTFPLTNKYIRQALNVALNRRKIATETLYNQMPHSSPLPVEYAHHQFNLDGDPNLANDLFERGLRELKIDLKTFPKLEIIHSNLAFEENLAAELKKQWKKVLGIDFITKELPWSEFSSALEKGLFQLGGLFRRDLFNHPQYYLNFFRSSSMNPYSLDNPEYEQLFNQIDKNQNPLEAIKRIEKLLIDEAPIFPLACQVSFGLIQDHIQGVSWHTNGCLKLDEVFFDEKTTAPTSALTH